MSDRFRDLTSEGALLPSSFLERLAANDQALPGLAPADYHLAEGERLTEAIASAWNRLQPAWRAFQAAREAAGPAEALTGPTRERWLLPLFAALGFGRLAGAKPREAGGRSYPISHGWSEVPIHLLGAGVDLDRRSAGVAGAARSSPHGLVQEYLNRAEHALWGIVSNGVKLRLLRDSAALSRQAYLEFDLEGIFSEEAFGEFTLLFLLVHPSRFEGERPEKSLLERWAREAAEQGTRALDSLRDGVQNAIQALGRGFLEHAANRELADALRQGTLSKQDYYRELLREVYRLIFLFVAEDRGLLLSPEAGEGARERYARFFSTARLRRLAARRLGTRHVDLWRTYRQVVGALSSVQGLPELALPALGGFLFSPSSTPWLDRSAIANRDLLEAVRALATTKAEGGRLVTVDWRNLGSEELGSVYEALLELHPEVHLGSPEAGTLGSARFELSTAAGHERKTTGSYYTPSSLIQCLLDSALDPVIDEAAAKPDPAAALLALKVCDPACGSGHFLIAAAHRIAKRLAAVRSGEEEPSPEAVRAALRDVIGHCLYGVDINPMAVELCKVNLWLESQDPRFALSFLDHRIQCGNSLLGTTPKLLAGGIPDEAFTAIEGDDKEVCRELKRLNKKERQDTEDGQLRLDDAPWLWIGRLTTALAALDALPDGSVADVRAKERRYAELVGSPEYDSGRFLADAWCAAFVWRKVDEPGHPRPITEAVFRVIERNPQLESARRARDEVRRLAEEYRFLHWHLAFPDVFSVPPRGAAPRNETMGWSGGFDCVLGNPPWERIKLQEKEFFAERDPIAANAPNKAARERRIRELEAAGDPLYQLFKAALRTSEGESTLVRSSGAFPLTGKGDVNTYALFAERKRQLLSEKGRVGCIVPSGIATDDTTKEFFQALVESGALVSLFDFQSGPGLFGEIGHARFKFCLLTMQGASRARRAEAEFAFFLRDVALLRDPRVRFKLTAEEIRLLNPNTRTCPIFRSRRDAEITKAIYRRVPVLIEEEKGDAGNPWGVSFLRLLDMSNDSGLFRTRPELEREGYQLGGNVFIGATGRCLPLYEAKMVHHFDHRYGDYADKAEDSESTALPEVPDTRLADPAYGPLPRYWVPEGEVAARLVDRWDRGWLLGWRDICRSTDERTVIAAVIPRVGAGDTFLLMLPDQDPRAVACCASSLSSFVLDYAARQKVGGTHLKYHVFKQLPILPPVGYSEGCPWDSGGDLASWLVPRTLELTYTAHDLASFARDCGWDGPPFRWEPERRFEIRYELDAAFFHLYGIGRDDVDYILDTFPIVRRDDEKRFGEFRTKRRILELYDRMQRAMETGEAFVSELDPPPGDVRAAHEVGTLDDRIGAGEPRKGR